jgi:hypothetical protein
VTGLVELTARVAPDYARMLARLAGAMLPDVAEVQQQDGVPADGRSEAFGTGELLAPRSLLAPEFALQAAARDAGAAQHLQAARPSAAPLGSSGLQAGAKPEQAASAAQPKQSAAAEMPAGVWHGGDTDVPRLPSNAAPGGAAISDTARGERMRLGTRSRGRPTLQARRNAPQSGPSQALQAAAKSQSLTPSLPHGANALSPLARLNRAHRAIDLRPPPALQGPVAASLSGEAALLPAIAWAAPDLMLPRGWPEPPPRSPDPFADAALEDALGELLERTALAGGIDL